MFMNPKNILDPEVETFCISWFVIFYNFVLIAYSGVHKDK